MHKCSLLLGVTLCLLGLPPLATAETFNHPVGHFKVVFNKNDFNRGDARDLANALEQARDFYGSAGFPVPQREIKVKLRARKGNTLGAYNALTGNIKIIMPLDKEGAPSGSNDTRAKRRFTAAHELFHAVQFEAVPAPTKINLGLLWLNTKLGLMPREFTDEFWLIFEGMAETMAWMAFPDVGADPTGGDIRPAVFWYDQSRFAPEGCTYPFAFVDPWRITPACTPSDDLEALGRFTIPFWLGVGQFLAGPFFDRAAPLSDIFQSVSQFLFVGGIDSVLHSAGVTRSDIRDRLSLSAGVERFGDERPHRSEDHWNNLLREFERAGSDAERQPGYLSWAIDASLAPPNFEPGNTIRFTPVAPFLSQVPATPADGRLEAFNFAGHLIPTLDGGLPTFAGEMQGINTPGTHPLATDVVPPATILLRDDSPNVSPSVRPLVIAGYQRPGATLFRPRMAEVVPGDKPVYLALNNFRLRDLSVLRAVPRSPELKYHYGFLNEYQGSLSFGETQLTRLDDGQWIVREVKRPLFPFTINSEALIMITPATVPDGSKQPWMDSDIYDMVARAENKISGFWSNAGAPQLNTHVGSAPFPASEDVRVRVDIARFAPGDHGGGRYYLTAAIRRIGSPAIPDLLVRAHTVDFEPGSVGAQGCSPTAHIAVYVTNQGDADATDVSLRVTGDLAMSGPFGQVDTKHFDRTKTIVGIVRPGETRARTFHVQAPAMAPETAIKGNIVVDHANNVGEYVEDNNEAKISPRDFDCGRKTISADAELMRLTEQPGALPSLEKSMPERSTYFTNQVRPVLDWLRERVPRPDSTGDPRYELLLDRLAPMRNAGLFRPDAARFFATQSNWSRALREPRLRTAPELRRRVDLWLAARQKPVQPSMPSYPGVLRATPAGLFVQDGERIIAAEPSKPWALLGFDENMPLSDIFLNGEGLDFDTEDGLLPIPPGRHTVRVVSQESEWSHVWHIEIGNEERHILSIP